MASRAEILSRAGRTLLDETEEDETGGEGDDARSGGGGGQVKLLPWTPRKAERISYDGPGGHPVPLIDRAPADAPLAHWR